MHYCHRVTPRNLTETVTYKVRYQVSQDRKFKDATTKFGSVTTSAAKDFTVKVNDTDTHPSTVCMRKINENHCCTAASVRARMQCMPQLWAAAVM